MKEEFDNNRTSRDMIQSTWKGRAVTTAELQARFLGYCKDCGRLNVKALVIGHFDEWIIQCPGCGRENGLNDLKFRKP